VGGVDRSGHYILFMSSGRVHAKASLILAAGFSIGALISQDARLLRCASGALIGIFIAPDLDLTNGGIVAGNLIRQKVGWAGQRAWKLFWVSYSNSLKHGSWLSHFPLLSTFVRLAYIYFWSVVLFYALSLALLPLGYYYEIKYELIWWVGVFLEPMFFYGLASSDTIHFFLDILTKEKSN
jgi:uncharacterized metal-binding protein